jgi:hypothetical protein
MFRWTPSGGTRFPILAGCLAVLFLVGASAAVAGQSGQNRQPPVTPLESPAPLVAARSSAPALDDAAMERFLSKAKIVRTQGSGKGVTDSLRATLSDGSLTHDAHIQTVDEQRREFRGTQGVEFDFRDSWAFNVAAYKLDRLLGLDMVPVSVSRSYRSTRGAVTWWVDNVVMDEGGRVKKNATPPPEKALYWSEQLHMMRIFDQLIHNTDRNLGNMLIGEDWRLWAIDHTRAFRKHTALRSPAQVQRCDREVFERLKALDAAVLSRELGRLLDGGQIRGILARRAAIVERLESLGPGALFDRQPHTPPDP